MASNYLSVKEFAAAAGVSDKAIYQQMQTRLKEYVTEEEGIKKIDAAALEKFFKKEDRESQGGKDTSRLEIAEIIDKVVQVSSQVSTLELESLKNENKLLKDALQEKERTIEFLKEQIRELQDRLKEAHSTTAIQQQLMAIEKKIEQDAAATREEKQKLHWWNRKKNVEK